MNNRHAYLIMAHNEFDILEKQLVLLDDYRNDIYIHIDEKVSGFDFDYYKKIVRKSNVYYTSRINVRWGHFSQIQCELTLLKQAIEKEYMYYHLISGVDLPLKPQSEIHDFFKENNGLEFVHFCSERETENIKNRVLHYHLMRWSRNNNKYINNITCKLNPILNKVQTIINFQRTWEDDIELQYGAQWFSITNDLAKYVISKEQWINKYFKYTSCSDELFLQTIVYNSKFKENVYMKEKRGNYISCMRYIDWNRGNPYIFKNEDFEEIINCNRLFARKFSSKVDNEVINRIYHYLSDTGK